MKTKLLLLAILFVVGALACTCSTSSLFSRNGNVGTPNTESNKTEMANPAGKTATNPGEAISPPAGPITGKAGEVIADGTVRFVVNGWMEESAYEDEPDPDMRYLGIDITLVNAGTEVFDFLSFEWFLRDSQSQEYEANDPIFSTVYDNDGFQNIFPGDRFRGVVHFKAPKTTSGYTLEMTPRWENKLNFADVYVPIGEEGVVDPPSFIDGEIPPQVHPKDSSIPCLKWTIQAFAMGKEDMGVYSDLFPSGWQSLWVDVSLHNGDSKTLTGSAADSMNIWLQNNLGRRYKINPSSGFDADIFNNIESGKTVRGKIAFFAKENPGELRLVWRCGALDQMNLSWDRVYIQLPAVGN
jgi:hypothetical protein